MRSKISEGCKSRTPSRALHTSNSHLLNFDPGCFSLFRNRVVDGRDAPQGRARCARLLIDQAALRLGATPVRRRESSEPEAEFCAELPRASTRTPGPGKTDSRRARRTCPTHTPGATRARPRRRRSRRKLSLKLRKKPLRTNSGPLRSPGCPTREVRRVRAIGSGAGAQRSTGRLRRRGLVLVLRSQAEHRLAAQDRQVLQVFHGHQPRPGRGAPPVARLELGRGTG